MMLFGRSKHQLECITTEFLPSHEQLHIVVADADMNLQILQYDPESTSPPLTCLNSRLTKSPRP
jgi:cleavage and polyadenylation specificity factor subunit 1